MQAVYSIELVIFIMCSNISLYTDLCIEDQTEQKIGSPNQCKQWISYNSWLVTAADTCKAHHENAHRPLLIVNAGDHCDRNISRHMLPLLFMFGWYILVVKASWTATQTDV